MMFRLIVMISVIIPHTLTDTSSIVPRLGIWSVRDCILARLSMKFIVPQTDSDSDNNIWEISLPPTAKVDIDSDGNDCRNDTGKDQKLTLLWNQGEGVPIARVGQGIGQASGTPGTDCHRKVANGERTGKGSN